MTTNTWDTLRRTDPPIGTTLPVFTSTAPRTALLSYDMKVTVVPLSRA